MYIFAKLREGNVPSCEINGGNETSRPLETRGIGCYRFDISPVPYSYRSGHTFLPPEESFLGRCFTPPDFFPGCPPSSDSLPEWAKNFLPPPRITQLSIASFEENEASVTMAFGMAPNVSRIKVSLPYYTPEHSLTKGTPSSLETPDGRSSPDGGGKKTMRYVCRTCSERLPTLNSLRIHLKSHPRQSTAQKVSPLSIMSDCVVSQVVTSKYGRCRPVISAVRTKQLSAVARHKYQGGRVQTPPVSPNETS